jgi:hypothetical protein
MSNHDKRRDELTHILYAIADDIGETPNTIDILAAGGPTASTYRRNFRVKTWDEVIEAVGLPPVVRHVPHDKICRLDPISKDDVIVAFTMFVREHKYMPMVNEYHDLYAAARKVFKDDREIIESCGYDYDVIKRATDIERRRRRDLPIESDVCDGITRATGYSYEFVKKLLHGDYEDH